MCSKTKWPKVWFRPSRSGKGEEKAPHLPPDPQNEGLLCPKKRYNLQSGFLLFVVRNQSHTSLLGRDGKGAGEWLCFRIFAPDRDWNKHHTTAATAWSLRWSQQAGAALLSLILITHSCISFYFSFSQTNCKFILLIRKSPVKEMRLTDSQWSAKTREALHPQPTLCWRET